MNALLSDLFERLYRMARADAGLLFSYQSGAWTCERVVGVLVGHPGAYHVYPGGFIEQATARREPVRRKNAVVDAAVRQVLDRLALRDSLAIPLLADRGVVGAVCLHWLDDEGCTNETLLVATALSEALVSVLIRRDSPELAALDRQSATEENELRFRSFMAAIPANTWVKDDHGRFLFVNQRVTDLFHRGRSILGLTDFDIMPEPIARAVREDDARVREGSTVINREEDIPTTDGVLRSWLTTKFPIVEPSGRVTTGGIAIDVTALKAAQQAARDAGADLERSLELLSDAVVIAREGQILYANKALSDLLGVAKDGLVGRDLRSFMAPDEVAAFEATRQRLDAERTLTWERRLRSAGGREVMVEATGRTVSFRGQKATLAVIRDITERRASEQRLQLTDRLAALGTLAAGVAHEINNPLSYVLANVQLIRERVTPAAADDLFDLANEAHDGAVRIKRIVESMRTLMRPGQPKRGLVSLAQAVGHAVELAGNEVRHRARLELNLGALPRVQGDESVLVQVFVNLLTNAAHAMPQGDSGQRMVRVSSQVLPDGRARVSVQDDGVGMSREVLSRIFDPFFTTKPVNFGTGLGLTVSHAIIASHGGELTVESEVGRGSVFHVTLPAAEPLAAPPPQRTPGRARVLVVDDDELVARSISRLLSGHDVALASTAETALRELATREFDLVLCDVMMPGLDGAGLHRSVPPHVAERFAFITGGAFTEEAQTFLDGVKNPVLTKPIERDRLSALARQAAERAS